MKGLNIIEDNLYLNSFTGDSKEALLFVFPETGKIFDCNHNAVILFSAENKSEIIDLEISNFHKTNSTKDFNFSKEIIPFYREVLLTDRKNREFWAEMSVSEIKTGNKSYALLRIIDLTERIKAESELSKSPIFVHRIANASPNSIYVYDIEKNKIIYTNQKLARLLGYSNNDLLKMGADYPFVLIHPDEKEKFLKSFKNHNIAEDEVIENEYRLKDKKGSWHWICFRTSVFSFNQHGKVKEVIGVAQDITQRKQFELDNLRLASFPRENPNPILECDFSGKITYINPASESYMRKLGIELDEFIPKNHNEIVKNILKADYDYQVEVNLKDKIFQWVYHPVKLTGYIHIYGSDITDQKKVENKLIYDALHDILTGLPNRSLFIDRLNHAFAKKKRKDNYLFAVLFLDLDRFKIINDSLGHIAGDKLLIQISERLKENIRPGDTVARLGGDEFTILLDDINDINDAVSVSERIKKALSKVFVIDEHEIFTTLSIGIVLSSTEGITKAEDLLKNADIAMYKAKIKGKDRHEIFNQSMHEQTVNFLKIETDLWKAIEKNQFKVFYQPVISFETGKVSGFEALVRWNHPQKGILQPSEFIKIAQETGLIIHIDLWILENACKQLAEWNKIYPENNLSISVNLSGKHFSRSDFVEKVENIIKETRINPSCLKLEITERIIMESYDYITSTLSELKRLGIQFQIDDFGTGYLSLSYFHKLPIHALKVDKSFVWMIDNKENYELIKTMSSLALDMGINLIAEGVETCHQLEILKKINCKFGQGFLFSEPVASEAAKNIINDNYNVCQ